MLAAVDSPLWEIPAFLKRAEGAVKQKIGPRELQLREMRAAIAKTPPRPSPSAPTEPTPKAPEPDAQQQESDVGKTPKKAPKTKTSRKTKQKPAKKPTTAAKAPKETSKLELIGKMLRRPEGCTTQDVLEATGWPSVSMPQQAKALGVALVQEKEGRKTRYRAAA